MEKELTIALTIYEPKKREIDNYLYSFNKINSFYEKKEENPFQFLILGDNPEISNEMNEYIIKNTENINNCQYVQCEENLVRLGQVFKNIDLIKGRYLKTVDPDDFIIPEEIVEFVEEFLTNLENDNSLIIHSYNRVSGFEIHHEAIDFSSKQIFWKNKSFNPNSIYPMDIIKKINWNNNTLIWSDDLIGIMLIDAGAKFQTARDYSFYVNLAHGGVSVTNSFHKSDRFYNDTIKFLEISKNIIEDNEFKLEMFMTATAKPSLWFLKQVARDIYFNKTHNRFKKVKMIKKVFKMSDEIKKIKNKEYFWFKQSIKWKLLTNKYI